MNISAWFKTCKATAAHPPHTQPSMTNQLSAKAWIAVLEQAINDRERQGMREGRKNWGSDRLEIHQAEWGKRAGEDMRENIDVRVEWQLWQLVGSSGGGYVYNTIHPLFLGRWWWCCLGGGGGVIQWEFIFRALSGERPCVHPVYHDLADPIKILISCRLKWFLLCYQWSDWLPRPEKLFF